MSFNSNDPGSLLFAATLLGVFVCGACATGQGQAQAPTAQTTDEAVTYKIPNVVIAPGSPPETQTSKGVIVQVIPKPFEVTNTPTKECVPGPEQSSSGLLGGLIHVDNGQVQTKPYIVTTRTGVDFSPKTLTFQVKITNNTNVVMRLETAQFRLNIGDHEVLLSDSDLNSIKHTQLFPHDSKSFDIAGPDWGHNPDEALVTFQAIQVPNEIDSLGNAKDGAAFTWTFAAKLEARSAQTQKKVENLMLSAADAASMNCHPGGA
jgi:hypothetical protein